MRWQTLGCADSGTQPELQLTGQIPGLMRTVTTPEFAGMRFHEVRSRSVLNAVPPASAMPFRWTVNPYRGCSHACVYCFARNTHAWLELDPGAGFDREVVVKVNVAEVLRTQLSRSSWTHEHVAMGTNTDPYQRAEGRYRLMPGVISALADSGTPFSILTKGTLLRRDLPLLVRAAATVPVGLGVSLAVTDPELQRRLEPGTPTPAARFALVRDVRDAGLPCGVMLAPVLPWLTDRAETLESTIAALADAGATGVTVLALHLRPGTREWFMGWLAREHPDLVPRYRRLYSRGAYVPGEYRQRLSRTVQPLFRRYGFATRPAASTRAPSGDGEYPTGSLPAARRTTTAGRERRAPPPQARGADQLALL